MLRICLRLRVATAIAAASCFVGHGAFADDNPPTLVLDQPGEYSGRWKQDGGYYGDMILTVSGDAVFLRFEDAHKSCWGDKPLPVDEENGALLLESPFYFNIGGECGRAYVTFTIENGNNVHFVFERLKWNDEFEGEVTLPE